MFNRFTKNSDTIRLDLMDQNLPLLLRLMGGFDFLLGVAWLLAAFLTDYDQSSFLRFGIFGGFIMMFGGGVVLTVANAIDTINTRFSFNLQARTLHVQQKVKSHVYDFLPKEITFAQIKMFRLRVVRTEKPAAAPWMIELILQDGKFIPMSAFKSEQKARSILQDLRMALDKPVDEVVVTEHSFQAYKRSFLEQFGPLPKESPKGMESRLNR